MSLPPIVGNPIPPGVSVGPGAPMPNYQALPGTTWTPPMTGTPAPDSVTKHTGEQANWFISNHHVIRPWSNGYHEMIREGQPMFIARTMDEEDELQTAVNLYQLNHMMREGYNRAMAALDPSNPTPMPQGLEMTAATARDIIFGSWPDARGNVADTIPGIGEADIMEYLGRPRAMEEEIPNGLHKERLRKLLQLAEAPNFRYLFAPAIAFRWNLWGVVNNISVGTSPEGRVRATQSHRKYSPSVVVNCVVAKKVYVSNVWGHTDVVSEGTVLNFVLRRKMDDRGDYHEFEMVPVSNTNVDGVPDSERIYEDHTGAIRYGIVIPLGTCSEIGNRPPAEHKRRQAIGNGANVSMAAAHDAFGSLPQIVVQVRV